MAKPTLILLHGALGAKSQFEPWLPLLEPHFDLHTFDFEGHGSEDFADRPFGIEHFAQNLEDYLQDHDLQGADIFGYSMGGYVAMYLALVKPSSLGRIFTFATKLSWNKESAAKEVKMLNPDAIEAKVPKFAEMLRLRHHGNEWKTHLAKTAEMMLELGELPILRADDLKRLEVPVRFGIGDRDKMVSLEETIAGYQLVPESQLFVMPDTPHPIEKIDAERMCAEIRSYFQ